MADIQYVSFTRGGRAFVPLADSQALLIGDVVHMLNGLGRMDLVREDAVLDPGGTFECLRVTMLFLAPGVPRGQGHGTQLHRACERKVEELGLLMASATTETLNGNPATTAMHDRLLEEYPRAVPWKDSSYVLLR